MKDRNRIKRMIRIRQRICDSRRAELMAVDEHLRNAEKLFSEADASRLQAIAGLTSEGDIPASELAARAHMVSLARQRAESAHAYMDECQKMRDQAQEHLRAAFQDKQAMEALEKRVKKESERRYNAFQQEICDEAAARIWSEK